MTALAEEGAAAQWQLRLSQEPLARLSVLLQCHQTATDAAICQDVRMHFPPEEDDNRSLNSLLKMLHQANLF